MDIYKYINIFVCYHFIYWLFILQQWSLCYGNRTGGRTSYYDYYYDEPYSVTIRAGDTRVLFSIRIFDDSRIENNETFHLFIDKTSLPLDVTAGSANDTTIIIVDDDCECLYN